MLVSNNDILNYRNSDLVQRYERDYPENRLSGEDALSHLMQYFYLCQKHTADLAKLPQDEALQFQCHMYTEMSEIDDMWHTFLLFTQEYADFCSKYCGAFMHHVPASHQEPYNPTTFEPEFVRFLSYAYDNVGEETVKVWFSELL